MSAIQQILVAIGPSGGSVDPTALSIYSKIASSIGGVGAYWDLSESSGSRFDTANGYATLSQLGTVGTNTGPRGGGDVAAATSTGNALYFGSLSGDAIDVPSGGGSHCIFGWAYLNSNTGTQFMASRWDGVSSSTLAYAMSVQSGTEYGQNGGTSYTNASTTPPTAAAWHFHVVWRDAADGKVRISVDGGTAGVSSGSSNPNNANRNFNLGQSGGSANYLAGRLSRFGYIKGNFLTSTEITWLINSGQGRNWAEIKSLAGY